LTQALGAGPSSSRRTACASNLATSSGLSTTGRTRGTLTGRILAIRSASQSVTSKKNFSPVIAALSEVGEMP